MCIVPYSLSKIGGVYRTKVFSAHVFVLIFNGRQYHSLGGAWPLSLWRLDGSESALVVIFPVKPPPYNIINAEDEAFRQYLEENGIDVSVVGVRQPTYRNETRTRRIATIVR